MYDDSWEYCEVCRAYWCKCEEKSKVSLNLPAIHIELPLSPEAETEHNPGLNDQAHVPVG